MPDAEDIDWLRGAIEEMREELAEVPPSPWVIVAPEGRPKVLALDDIADGPFIETKGVEPAAHVHRWQPVAVDKVIALLECLADTAPAEFDWDSPHGRAVTVAAFYFDPLEGRSGEPE